MLKIPRHLTISNLERLHIDLANAQGKIDLILPFDIERAEFNSVPMLIQLVATWIRSDKSGRILVQLPNIDDSTLEAFIKQDYNYAICILAWRNGVYNSLDNLDIRPRIKEYNRASNFKMKSLKGFTGQQMMLTCFDHTSPENGLLNCFYDGSSFISSEAFLEFTLLPALTSVLQLNRAMLKDNFVPIQQHIIDIIYELMKNTHEWARTDTNHKPLNPNIRGLYARLVRRNKELLLKENESNQMYAEYFESLQTNTNNEIYFIEIDVFDSGSGFVEKWPEHRNNSSPSERFDIIRKCLIKNYTAASNINATGKGRGLDRILNILDNKGLLFIRTDRLSVYRNMKLHRYIPTTEKNQVQLFDSVTHTSTKISERTYVSGSAISIIYPIS